MGFVPVEGLPGPVRREERSGRLLELRKGLGR